MPRNPSREVDSTDHVFQRLATVDQACARYCLTRPKIYLLARESPKIMRRLFGRTVVDLAVMDELVDALPTASEAPTALIEDFLTRCHTPSHPKEAAHE